MGKMKEPWTTCLGRNCLTQIKAGGPSRYCPEHQSTTFTYPAPPAEKVVDIAKRGGTVDDLIPKPLAQATANLGLALARDFLAFDRKLDATGKADISAWKRLVTQAKAMVEA